MRLASAVPLPHTAARLAGFSKTALIRWQERLLNWKVKMVSTALFIPVKSESSPSNQHETVLAKSCAQTVGVGGRGFVISCHGEGNPLSES